MSKSLENKLPPQEQDTLFQEVKDFIAAFSGHNKDTISMDTRLNFDIKIDGDDASEFIQEVNRRYGVDFKGFEFENYFSNEGFTLIDIKSLLCLLQGKKRYQPLYVSDLLKAIKAGAWVG